MNDSAAKVKVRDPLVGRVLGGKFQLDAVVGRGAMGTVYRATQLALDKLVAVKVMHPTLGTDENFHARFLQEARTASRFEHPNSVQVLDYGSDPDGTTYIAMEYLAGRMLSDEIADGMPLPLERVVEIMSQVLSAVAAAHDAGIVHRDLKPENVMLVRKTGDEGDALEVVKVTDFGIAKLIAGGRDGRGAPKLTTAGLVAGTPEYMSPEQGRGESVDGRSDLYACGVMLFELCTGSLPFTGESAIGIVLKHVTDPPPPASKLNPDIDPQLEAIIARALEKDRDSRFQDARSMRAALRALVPGYANAGASAIQRPPSALSSTAPLAMEASAPAQNRAPLAPTETFESLAISQSDSPSTGIERSASSSGAAHPSPAPSNSSRLAVALGAVLLAGAVVVAQRMVGPGASSGPGVTVQTVRAPAPSAPPSPIVAPAPAPEPESTVPPPTTLAAPSTPVRVEPPVAPPPVAPPPVVPSSRERNSESGGHHGSSANARETASSPPIAPAPAMPSPAPVAPAPVAPAPAAPAPAAPAPVAVAPAPVAPAPAAPRAVHAQIASLAATGGITRGALIGRAERAAAGFASCASRQWNAQSAGVSIPGDATITITVRDQRLDDLSARTGRPWLDGCVRQVRDAFGGQLPAGDDNEYTVTLRLGLAPTP